jgi:hypothetical protein
MIPGIASQKNFLEREKLGVMNGGGGATMVDPKFGKPMDPKYAEKQDRMKMYGFSRDPREARAIANGYSTLPQQ